jgi:hypothetical protein
VTHSTVVRSSQWYCELSTRLLERTGVAGPGLQALGSRGVVDVVAAVVAVADDELALRVRTVVRAVDLAVAGTVDAAEHSQKLALGSEGQDTGVAWPSATKSRTRWAALLCTEIEILDNP